MDASSPIPGHECALLGDKQEPMRPTRRPFCSRSTHLASIVTLAALSYLMISHYILQTVKVVGVSMAPTLADSECYLLNRWVLHVRQPGTADIVVIRDPVDNGFSVKRVIGRPGDTVYIKEGRVYLNGEILQEPYLPNGNHDLGGAAMPGNNRSSWAKTSSSCSETTAATRRTPGSTARCLHATFWACSSIEAASIFPLARIDNRGLLCQSCYRMSLTTPILNAFRSLASRVLNGGEISREEALWLWNLQDQGDIYDLLAWANRIRKQFKGNKIHLCSIVNVKAGGCPENCRFCAQSATYQTDAPRYGFIEAAAHSAGGGGSQTQRCHRPWPGRRLARTETKGPILDEICSALQIDDRGRQDAPRRVAGHHQKPGGGRPPARKPGWSAITTISKPRAGSFPRSAPRTPTRSACKPSRI